MFLRLESESGDHSGQLVAGDRRCSVTIEAIGPGRGPRQLSRDESRRMNLHDDVVYRRLGRSTSAIPAVPAAWSVTTIAFMIIFSSVICLFAGYVPAIKSPFDI